MNYCSQCGQPVTLKIPVDDNRERFVCDHCGYVHYQNPNNVCGALLTLDDKILLCKRAIEPRYGLWTLPAGFMENNETVAEAAAREAMEEANAQAGPLTLFGIFSMPYISQVYLIFHGELASKEISAGHESLDVGMFTREQIPWNELAFPVVTHSLKLFFEHGTGKVHHAWFSRGPDRTVELHSID
ncbi:MAG: NUDIX hydrolase [Gammaproteobacteria bacterium]|nr:NUDIX hydrolase [Gammaproteobacteria bacterium]MDH3857610.1 NUDIX hydrolase [Gammaproteobacteria bacterium]